MRMKTSEAARTLGIHPSHLFQHLVELSPELTFEQVWPEIEDDWVRTIFASEHHAASPEMEQPVAPITAVSGAVTGDLSYEATKVLDKLTRQRKWGNASVSFDALRSLTHLSQRDLDHVVADLRRRNLLDHDGTGRGTISLNSAKRSEIEPVVEQTRAHAASKS